MKRFRIGIGGTGQSPMHKTFGGRRGVTRAVLAALAASAAMIAAPVQGRTQANQGPAQALKWDDVVARARGQTVHFNAWAGDERTNAFIAWTAEHVKQRYGITVNHVRLKDTAEAVTRVIAEKSAGRNTNGTVDLVWINGPNFLNMKQQNLLYGPFAQSLPNFRYVDTTSRRSNVVDFTTPVDGYASPWRVAQIVFIYDSARLRNPADLPRSAPALLAWAEKHPGRLTHPNVRNFLGSTFLKQALHDLVADPSVLQQPATDQQFDRVTAPLWAWYDKLRPRLWRQGKQFPENGPAQRQLMNDGEIDLMISFNPSEAAVAVENNLLPKTVRTFGFTKGTIGNTSFVAIPYNAPNREAAMVVANFLLEPATQAHAQDIRNMGNLSVLDMSKLSDTDKARFAELTPSPALPSAAEVGKPVLEPHSSWMTRIAAEWERRYTK